MFTRPGVTVFSSPAYLLPNSATKQDSGIVPLTTGDTSYAIPFTAGFSSITGISPALIPPNSSSPGIVPRVDYSTLTTSGVTIRFTAVPANYRLSWIAIGL